MDSLLSLLTYFCVLSAAAERAVEILKNAKLKDIKAPAEVYQILAGLVGSSVAFFFPPPLTTVVQFNPYLTVILTGLAVSGGSAFWNSVLDMVTAYSKTVKAVAILQAGESTTTKN